MALLLQFCVGLLYLQAILGKDVLTICSSNNKSTYEELQQKLVQMETQITRQDARIALQDAKLAKQEAELAKVQAQDMAVEAQMVLLKATVNNAFTTWNDSQQVTSFMTWKTGGNVRSREIVVFDSVKHSVAPPGFGYDAKIGHYRCPYDGTYAFYVHIMCSGSAGSTSSHCSFDIKKEEVILATASADVGSVGSLGSVRRVRIMTSRMAVPPGSRHVAAAAWAVSTCKKGEDVWVQNTDPIERPILTTTGKTYFSGFKIV